MESCLESFLESLLNHFLNPLLNPSLHVSLIPDIVDYPKLGSGEIFGSIKIDNFSKKPKKLTKIDHFNSTKYFRLPKIEFWKPPVLKFKS